MNAICVDDEHLITEYVAAVLGSMPDIDDAKGFTKAAEALGWIRENKADVALLDIDMPDMDGITLAREIKNARPETSIIFLTGYSQYASQAVALDAKGYLLKPASKEKIAAEVEYALSKKWIKPTFRVEARTFGEFELFVDGEEVSFSQARCKELLAYLVDRYGRSVTRPEAFAVLWEDKAYDRPAQKKLDTLIRSLRSILKKYDASEIFELKSGTMRIRPDKMSSDVWRFFEADIEAVNSYKGEYMIGYSWADMTEKSMNYRFSAGHLTEEYAMAGFQHNTPSGSGARVRVRTFGNFDIMVDGAVVSFRRSKSKEVLAYLIDARGRKVPRREIFLSIWEKKEYDRSAQKQLDVIIRDLRSTLEENGTGEILRLERGTLAIVPELIDCDMYRFADGQAHAISEYHGEYMSSYSWTAATEAWLDGLRKKK